MKEIKKIHIVYKTHLDIGFTDMSYKIVEYYLNDFIPKAIELANSINTKEKKLFIWTVGSWLIDRYLLEKKVEEKEKLIKAIEDGYITWHGLPFTTHSEMMTYELFERGIEIAKKLDEEFNKVTIAAKMTDVPGHTRGIIEPLCTNGIKYLHIGVNDVAHMPAVPETFIWKDSKGNEIIVNYCQGYGNSKVIEDFDEMLVLAHTSDNLGPPDKDTVLENIDKLKKQYPNAEIQASTLDIFAEKLLEIKDKLPVITEEIGDTWIHGVGSDPKKVSTFLEFLRILDKWDKENRVSKAQKDSILKELLMIPEHTWGLDAKKYLTDYINWDKEAFNKARNENLLKEEYVPKEYKKYEEFAKRGYLKEKNSLTWEKRSYEYFNESHNEQRHYIGKALSLLDKELKSEAIKVLNKMTFKFELLKKENLVLNKDFLINDYNITVNGNGSIIVKRNSLDLLLGKVTYQVFGLEHLNKWKKDYFVNWDKNELWAMPDNFKVGIEKSQIKEENQYFSPRLSNIYRFKTSIFTHMIFNEKECNIYGCPRECFIEYKFNNNDIEIITYFKDKDASRIPEGLWVSNYINSSLNEIILRKINEDINFKDVVQYGNRNYHCVNKVITIDNDNTIEIEPLDSPLTSIGEMRLYSFEQNFANINNGIHTNLYNNLWGTNFKMWYEEDIISRFKLNFK